MVEADRPSVAEVHVRPWPGNVRRVSVLPVFGSQRGVQRLTFAALKVSRLKIGKVPTDPMSYKYRRSARPYTRPDKRMDCAVFQN